MNTAVRQKYNRARSREFEYLSILGSGGFGLVIHCIKKNTLKHYAMKIISKQQLFLSYEETPWRVNAEKEAFASCSHPFLVELSYAFHTSTLAILVMSLGYGDLKQLLLNYPNGLNYNRVRFC